MMAGADEYDKQVSDICAECVHLVRYESAEWTHEGRWLRSGVVKCRDVRRNKEITWEAVQRTTRKGAYDAVEIIPIVRGGKYTVPHVILEIGFRPPASGFVIELPAGLVDGGEDPTTAALRELREETGWVGSSARVGGAPFQFNPAILDEIGIAVIVDVDANLPENQNPQPQMEENEFIYTLLVPLQGLRARLERYASTKELQIDARLYMFALGLEMSGSC